MSALRAIVDALRAAVDNLGLKLVSIVCALVLYAVTHGAADAQRTFTVDVVEIPPPESSHRVLLTTLPQVRAVVRGPRSALDEMRADDLGTLQLDLRNGRVERLDLDPSMIHVPPGVHVEQVEPASIELRWEDEVVRDIPVQASLAGEPAPGLKVRGAPAVMPLVVRARGPRSVVESMQHARLEPFDVTGLAHEGKVRRTLALDKPPIRTTFDTPSVTVEVDVERELLERLFVKVPVQVVGSSRASAHPGDVDVRVVGTPEVVRSLRTEQVVPRVELPGGQSTGSAALRVTVEIEHAEAHPMPALVVVRW